MDRQAIASALEQLDLRPEPAALRVDDGAALGDNLAILPSAFNPPTLAHQHLLERASSEISGARPVALLTTRNVDKGVYGASLAQRVEMLLALHGEWPELVVAACNQARIMDQVSAVAHSFGSGSSPMDLHFIVGFDTLERLFSPHYYDDVEAELTPFFERCRVLAANRADVSPDEVRDWIGDNAATFAGRIDVLEIGEFAASLSSTQAREEVTEGGSPDTVPAPVRAYIEREKLYADGTHEAGSE